SKDYKMKVYPSIGYIVVMLAMPFLRGNKFNISGLKDSDRASTFVFVGIIYFSSFLLMMALNQMIFSDKYKAAWIYFTTPIKAPGELINGALKAALVKFYFPVVVLVSATAMVITGPKLLPNLLLGILNEVLICSLIVYVTINQLPFSVPQSNNAKAGGFLKGLFMLAIPALVATFHFLIYEITPVV